MPVSERPHFDPGVALRQQIEEEMGRDPRTVDQVQGIAFELKD